MKKRYVLILMCMLILFISGCGKTTKTEESNTNKSPEENIVDDTNGNSKEESITSNVNKEQEENNEKDIQNSNIKFEVLENYKEKNISSVYMRGNGEEH